ncbi:MAG: hypothetical protein QF752_14210, partial [Planctomycetota bacterium]|nr:hypothetical protein [Planctomycetota bacterium]
PLKFRIGPRMAEPCDTSTKSVELMVRRMLFHEKGLLLAFTIELQSNSPEKVEKTAPGGSVFDRLAQDSGRRFSVAPGALIGEDRIQFRVEAGISGGNGDGQDRNHPDLFWV